MITRRRFGALSLTGLGLVALGFRTSALSQVISKPARIIVGFTPGGSADTIARLLAGQMRDYASVLVVDNRPGAGGRIGLEAAKNAAPDGSTMVLTPASMLVIYPHVYKTLNYDPLRDFVLVATPCSVASLLSIGPMVPTSVTTLADFIQWCKANPKQSAYGSPGGGTMPHFIGAMLSRAAGFEFTHVAYKGGAPSIQDLLGGQIAANITVISNALPHVKSGKLRPLATTGAARSLHLPDVPTLKESGFPDLEAVDWMGVLVPARTPPEVVASLRAAVSKAMDSEDVKAALLKQGFDLVSGSSPDDLARLIKRDLEKWEPVVKGTGYTADE